MFRLLLQLLHAESLPLRLRRDRDGSIDVLPPLSRRRHRPAFVHGPRRRRGAGGLHPRRRRLRRPLPLGRHGPDPRRAARLPNSGRPSGPCATTPGPRFAWSTARTAPSPTPLSSRRSSRRSSNSATPSTAPTTARTSAPVWSGMINPNLDAEHPVLLALMGSGGHAVVADGYGYDLSATDPDAVSPPEHGLGRGRRHVVQPAGRRQVQFRRRVRLQRLPRGQRRDHQRTRHRRLRPAGCGRRSQSEDPDQHIRGNDQRQRHLRPGRGSPPTARS